MEEIGLRPKLYTIHLQVAVAQYSALLNELERGKLGAKQPDDLNTPRSVQGVPTRPQWPVVWRLDTSVNVRRDSQVAGGTVRWGAGRQYSHRTSGSQAKPPPGENKSPRPDRDRPKTVCAISKQQEAAGPPETILEGPLTRRHSTSTSLAGPSKPSRLAIPRYHDVHRVVDPLQVRLQCRLADREETTGWERLPIREDNQPQATPSLLRSPSSGCIAAPRLRDAGVPRD